MLLAGRVAAGEPLDDVVQQFRFEREIEVLGVEIVIQICLVLLPRLGAAPDGPLLLEGPRREAFAQRPFDRLNKF